jgi:DNA uptake protein ComE-like DNA-binding protein
MPCSARLREQTSNLTSHDRRLSIGLVSPSIHSPKSTGVDAVIQNSNSQSFALHEHAARLGPNHGYSIEGDVALLHAEVAVPRDPQLDTAHWALQLWACDAPHAGGPLSGIKVAEATLPSTSHSTDPQPLHTEAHANVPGGLRDYSMVLVLASGEPGAFNQVHDFANYAERQRFITPHLEGSVGYQIDGEQVVLRAERIPNPRRLGNLSGSLSLELWALPHAYQSGSPEGTRLAALGLASIAGQESLEAIEQRAAFQKPSAGSWQIAMLLREWAGPAGYVTRDYCNFALPYDVEATRPETPQPSVVTAPMLIVEQAKPAVTTAATIAVEQASSAVTAPTLSAAQPNPAAASAAAPQPEPAAAAAPVLKAAPVAASASSVQQTPTVASAATPSAVQPKPAQAASTAAAPAKATSTAPTSSKPTERAPATTTKSLASTVATSAQPDAPKAQVSIMHASLDELAQVKGLNRKLAIEIIKQRPYASLDDLQRVRGIGSKMLTSLRTQLKL